MDVVCGVVVLTMLVRYWILPMLVLSGDVWGLFNTHWSLSSLWFEWHWSSCCCCVAVPRRGLVVADERTSAARLDGLDDVRPNARRDVWTTCATAATPTKRWRVTIFFFLIYRLRCLAAALGDVRLEKGTIHEIWEASARRRCAGRDDSDIYGHRREAGTKPACVRRRRCCRLRLHTRIAQYPRRFSRRIS